MKKFIALTILTFGFALSASADVNVVTDNDGLRCDARRMGASESEKPVWTVVIQSDETRTTLEITQVASGRSSVHASEGPLRITGHGKGMGIRFQQEDARKLAVSGDELNAVARGEARSVSLIGKLRLEAEDTDYDFICFGTLAPTT